MTDLDSLFDSFKEEDENKEPSKPIDEEICELCNQGTIQNNQGTIICTSCGNVKEIVIESGAEWRYYGSEDSKNSDPTRCGMPTNQLLPESSYGSTISYKNNYL